MTQDLIDDLNALPMVDNTKTAELRQAIGDETFDTLFATLPAEIRRLFEVLTSHCALSPVDMDGVRNVAHALKGVAANYGVTRLEAIGRALNSQDATETDTHVLVAYLKEQLAVFEALALAEPDERKRIA